MNVQEEYFTATIKVGGKECIEFDGVFDFFVCGDGDIKSICLCAFDGTKVLLDAEKPEHKIFYDAAMVEIKSDYHQTRINEAIEDYRAARRTSERNAERRFSRGEK
jgi:hypothetical protein